MTEDTDNAAEVVPIKRARKATKATPAKAAKNTATKEKTKNRQGRVVTENMIANYSELANKCEKHGDEHGAAYWRDLLEKVK